MARSRFLLPAACLLFLFTAFVASLDLRLHGFSQRTGAPGLEATYHALWTAKVLAATMPEQHFYLPSVTRAPEPGSPFAWGATVETHGGAYVYTSFPPLSFLLPKLLLSWRANGVDFFMLSVLNATIGFAAALLMGGLARAAALGFAPTGPMSPSRGWMLFTGTALVYLFLCEALTSHGMVYWAHSWAQLPLIFGAWMAFRLFQGRRDILTLLALCLSCLLYCSLEWTGFVFSFGLFCAFLLSQFTGRRGPGSYFDLGVAIAISASVALAGLLLIGHFAIAIGLGELLSALQGRASARAAEFWALMGILRAYFDSFGALIPVAFLAAAMLIAAKEILMPQNQPLLLLLFVASVPMLENILLVQHAFQFPFDRLKLALPLLLVSALYVSRLRGGAEMLFAALAVILVMHSNLQNFSNRMMRHGAWGDSIYENGRLLADFAAQDGADCLLLSAPGSVRAYLNLAFNADIVEKTDPDALLAIVQQDQRYCGFALIASVNSFVDLPTLHHIALFDRDGTLVTVVE